MKNRPLQLAAQDLSVGWQTRSNTTVLFENLNLSLLAGKLVCLMGPNGSGKSTLLRTFAGLQKPLGGAVITESKTGLPKLISVVLTNRISAAGMSVKELISFGRYPYIGWNIILSKADVIAIENSINQVQIEDIKDKEISQLSDGQMQMVMIARALAQDTPIILLDEPTAHLDLNNRLNIMKLLKSLSRKMDKAILLASHELDLALQTADEIWLTGRNKNIITGTPEDLVLNGSFDNIFQFKGFDLKSGKVQHEPYSGTTIYIEGSGPEFFWTRNALERSGLKVSGSDEEHKGSALRVKVVLEQSLPLWILDKDDQQFKTGSIAELIELLSEQSVAEPE